MKKRYGIWIVILLILCSMFSGCTSAQNSIVGKWICDEKAKDGQDLYAIFSKDGKYQCIWGSTVVGVCAYEYVGSRLTLYDEIPMHLTVTVTGNRLEWTSPYTNKTIYFTRIN